MHAQHPWDDVQLSPGDAVNVLAERVDVGADGRAHATVDTSSGMLILHPDVLLSGACMCV